MGKKGLEPPTLRLSSVYSNQLSYLPFFILNQFRIKTFKNNFLLEQNIASLYNKHVFFTKINYLLASFTFYYIDNLYSNISNDTCYFEICLSKFRLRKGKWLSG